MAAQKGVSDGLLLGGIALLLGGTTAVWLAAEFGGLYDHGYWPNLSFADAGKAIRRLVVHPGDVAGAWPAGEAARIPSASVFYSTLAVLLVLLLALLWSAARAWLRRTGRGRQRVTAGHGTATVTTTVTAPASAPVATAEPPAPATAMATAGALADTPSAAAIAGPAPAVAAAASAVADPGPALERRLSRAAVLARARSIRGSLTAPPANLAEIAIALGREPVSGVDLYGTLEDSYCLIGPPRSGKSALLLNPAIQNAPGAVLATGAKPDTLRATVARRERLGPVSVFDPQQLSGWPRELRWSLERGCDRATTALLRAAALTAPVQPVADGASGRFAPHAVAGAQTVIRCYLHALAVDDRPVRHALRWMADPDADTPVRLLRESAQAADGWADELDALRRADEDRRAAVWAVVRQALAALRDPRVLAACSPERAEELDVAGLVRERGTLYLLGATDAQPSVAPILTALVAEVVEHSQRLATRMPAGRLDPPLLLALDEVAALAPLPELPELVAAGGGLGLTPMLTLRSPAQARARWGAGAATALRDAASLTVAFGGLSALGSGASSPGPAADAADSLWTLPYGEAALLCHGLPPIRAVLTPDPS